MTPTELEELAKKLTALVGLNYYCLDTINGDLEKRQWLKISREIAAMVLEARMQETDRYLDLIGSNNRYYIHRRSDLQTQITALRGDSK